MILSVDPGVKGCGVACWAGNDKRLVYAGYVKGDVHIEPFMVWGDLEELLIEKPQIYQQSKWKGDPNDLVDLAVVVGQIAERAARYKANVKMYKPREWAGQVPKEIRWKRVQEKIAEELAKINWAPLAKGLHHNIHDAIGIGLFHLRRR